MSWVLNIRNLLANYSKQKPICRPWNSDGLLNNEITPFQFIIGYPLAPDYISSKRLLADRTGLEPATSAVTGQHSNQLNYRSFFMM